MPRLLVIEGVAGAPDGANDLGILGIGLDQGRYSERTPPFDMLAEQSAIGGMLLSKDAVADCLETVRGPDFYQPKHEIIYEAILSLYSRGEPTDVITVFAECRPPRRSSAPRLSAS